MRYFLLLFLLLFVSPALAATQPANCAADGAHADVYNTALNKWTCVSLTVSGSSALSALTSATTTNTIDNANFAQTWSWNTLTTQNALKLTSTSLTTGKMLDIEVNNAASTGYAGYFSNTGTSASAYAVQADGQLGVKSALNFTSTTATLPLNGWYSPVANALALSTSGSQHVTVLNNGNLGIGVSSPATRLDLGTGTENFVDANNSGITYTIHSANISGDDRLIVTSNGTGFGSRIWFDTPTCGTCAAGFTMAYGGTEELTFVGGNPTAVMHLGEDLAFTNSSFSTFGYISNSAGTWCFGCSSAAASGYNIEVNGNAKIDGVIKTNGYTVSGLPSGTVGMRAYVTNQLTACVVAGAALTGGGSVVCPVFYNGTAWVGD